MKIRILVPKILTSEVDENLYKSTIFFFFSSQTLCNINPSDDAMVIKSLTVIARKFSFRSTWWCAEHIIDKHVDILMVGWRRLCVTLRDNSSELSTLTNHDKICNKYYNSRVNVFPNMHEDFPTSSSSELMNIYTPLLNLSNKATLPIYCITLSQNNVF